MLDLLKNQKQQSKTKDFPFEVFRCLVACMPKDVNPDWARAIVLSSQCDKLILKLGSPMAGECAKVLLSCFGELLKKMIRKMPIGHQEFLYAHGTALHFCVNVYNGDFKIKKTLCEIFGLMINYTHDERFTAILCWIYLIDHHAKLHLVKDMIEERDLGEN